MNITMNISNHRPTVNITLEKRRKTKEGKHNYKLWVTFKVGDQFKQRMYKTPYYATIEEHRLIMAEGKDKTKLKPLVDIRLALRRLEADVSRLIEEKSITTQEAFELNYLSGINTETLRGQFEIKILHLEAANKISSAEKYRIAINSFEEYSHPDLTFQEITIEWLNGYETWFINTEGKDAKCGSLTTVGINMRCLRHIFKTQVRAGKINEKMYPFGIGGYVIPEGEGKIKNYLDEKERKAFLKHRFNDDQDKYHDYAVFCYYANGLNFSDIFRLRKREVNYKDEIIERIRQKTKGRTKRIKLMRIILHPAMIDIIKRRSDKLDINPNSYLFPVLKDCTTEKEVFHKVRSVVKKTNGVLAAIAKKLELPITPTTYSLRHTFAYSFMQAGGTTEELQEALGHGDIRTTEAYKHGFSLKRKRKLSGKL